MSAKSYGDTNIIQTRLRGSKLQKSPATPRKSSRSPARKSSPPAQSKRSPARKSPSRKPVAKSPTRKSPSRPAKEVAEVAPRRAVPAQKEPSRRPALKHEAEIRLEKFSTNLEIYRSTRSKRAEYTVSDVTSTQNEINTGILDKFNGLQSPSTDYYGLRNRKPYEEVLPRRSSRLQEFIDHVPDIRRSLSKSVSQSKSRKSISKSVDTYSDDDISGDEIKREKLKSVTRRLSTPLRSNVNITMPIRWEFGGQFGTVFLAVFIPMTVLAIVASCTKKCSFDISDVTPYESLDTWFSLDILKFVVVQVLIQTFFAITPIFGTKADRFDGKSTKYCFNAFSSCIFTVTMLFLLDFYQLIDKYILMINYLRLSLISYIFAVFLSIILYVKSSKMDIDELNSYGNTGYVFYDYFMGKEIHPFIKMLDVKVLISRISNINTLILLLLIFSQGIQIKLDGNVELTLTSFKETLLKTSAQPTILIFSTMQIIYSLNFIIQEYKVTSTFFWNYEGLGYMQIVCSSLYPFYFTTISKYVADRDLKLANNELAFALVIYMLGFLLMLFSNNIKHEFRSNPIHPSLAKFNSIPTFHGKKLLVSSFWGSLRHPNYTGDILIHLVLAIPGILTQNIIAASPAIITIGVLIHRSWRDHERCKKRYGAAWQNYCKRVPHVLVPKVL